MGTTEVTLALPAYNESENISSVLDESIAALEHLGKTWEVIVIDNFSSDNTTEIAKTYAERDPRVRVIRHEKNRLYSGSCATAIREANGEFVAIMDSDGQALAADLPLFIERLDKGANLVFGWRKKRNDPFSRLAISAVFNWLGKLKLKFPFHDLNCGYRVFDRTFLDVAEINHEVNMANPELYVRAYNANLKLDEVAIQHLPRAGGGSSHDFLRSWKLFLIVNRYFSALRKEMKTR
ncbi:MAG: glycosyltransferase family 2 protein [Acidimicrobiia bacterium]|nr:glycosyltransferase family 2 protein [Acidimicrobiia bacterium]MDX2468014.1 glycosyltransferase family 2 protein [Acidimicrobiia bacterium]